MAQKPTTVHLLSMDPDTPKIPPGHRNDPGRTLNLEAKTPEREGPMYHGLPPKRTLPQHVTRKRSATPSADSIRVRHHITRWETHTTDTGLRPTG